MDYSHTDLGTMIQYKASDMLLYVNFVAAYLVLSKAQSRGIEYFYLSNHTSSVVSTHTTTPNGPILTECATLYNVMISTAEDETITLQNNGIITIFMCVTF